MKFPMMSEEKEEKRKNICQWCEREVDEQSFGSYRPGILVMMKFTVPLYFDSKECLLNWIKGLVKADETK